MRYRPCVMLFGIATLAGCAKNGTPAPADSAASAATTAPSSVSSAAPVDAKDARHAIDSMYTKFTDAMVHGDAKTMGAMYASDAVADVPGAPLLTGADAITKAFAQNFTQASIQNPSLHTDDVITGGNLAVETGTWSWGVQPKSGGKVEAQKGPYITVWRHEADGTWKIIRDYVTAAPSGT